MRGYAEHVLRSGQDLSKFIYVSNRTLVLRPHDAPWRLKNGEGLLPLVVTMALGPRVPLFGTSHDSPMWSESFVFVPRTT